jgi:CRISPR locus-related DNA-binding protein
MTTFVSTLGFNTSHLQSLIVGEDVEDGDHLVLVRPDDDDQRGKGAVQDIEGLVDMIDQEITTELLKFDPDDFEGTTTALADFLDDIDDELVVNLAGGDRALVLALTVATMPTTADLRSTYIRSDVTQESHEVQLPTVRPRLNDRDREVLKYIVENGPVSNTRIAAVTGKSDTTVHRSVNENLEEMGYVEVRDDGGKNSVRATFVGELIYNRLS